MFKMTRYKHELKQKEMANILNVTQSMISHYEKGLKKPDYNTMYNFYKKFGINELTEELLEQFKKDEIKDQFITEDSTKKAPNEN